MQDLAKPRKISPYLSPPRKHARYRTNTNGALTAQWTSMTNFHESNTRAIGMHQEPCGSENDSGFPCASDERLVWTRESAEQAVNTPNDEERLEQMSHPKNKVMERMTPLERWNGLAWVCTVWLWKGLARGRGGVFSGHSVPPNPTRSTRQALTVWRTHHFHFFPRQTMETPSARAHKQTTAQATIQEALQADVSRNVRHVLEDSSGMDTDGLERVTDGLENWVSPKKCHQRSQSTGCVSS